MDLLRVRHGKIVDASAQPVRLRGVCVGGWMNMEHFINGYPGSEYSLRATMAQVLGPGKARFFFERLLDYVLDKQDIAFIRECGATVVRLPLNYRHFERDDEPFQYLEPGFGRLDRALRWCADHGLYAILDLHAAQGWQNTDWHCDNTSRHVLLWQHRQFQDRFVALWEEFARRYEGNPAVAGYNVMNEPVTNAPRGRLSNAYVPDWDVINRLYRRVARAIRAIDADHIIFLEGDYFSTLFEGLDEPFADNLVYSTHNYNPAGSGPGAYPGLIKDEWWDREKQVDVFLAHQGTQFALRHHVPLWIGEFGSVQGGPAEELPDRVRACGDQIDVFEEYGAHWTTWTYKDIGRMGWVKVDPESAYMQTVAPVLEAKHLLGVDFFWSNWEDGLESRQYLDDLARHIEQTIGDPDIDPEANRHYLAQEAMSGYVAALMQPAYAKRFKGMTENEIDSVLQSFALENCQPNQAFVNVLRKHLARPM